jgi:hypothetical protein
LLSLAPTDYSAATVNTEGIKNLLTSSIRSAKRHGIWFTLARQERTILNLCARLDVKFRSKELMRMLASILSRIGGARSLLQAKLARGVMLAWNYSESAVRWGNSSAREWRNDLVYIRFLGDLFWRGRYQ